MKPIKDGPTKLPMKRRTFLTGAALLGASTGLSVPTLASCDADSSDTGVRDQDLPFIGVEETFSTPELLTLNSINEDHIAYLEEIGLSDLGACSG